MKVESRLLISLCASSVFIESEFWTGGCRPRPVDAGAVSPSAILPVTAVNPLRDRFENVAAGMTTGSSTDEINGTEGAVLGRR